VDIEGKASLSAWEAYKTYRRVVGNKGSCGVDGIEVADLHEFLSMHQRDLVRDVLAEKYLPAAIRGVEIPKSIVKKRLLGIATEVSRWLQQAVSQHLITRFEIEFSDHSYGFRPKKNMQQALQQSLAYINAGCSDIVDINLSKFFDEVAYYKILQLIFEKVKCATTLRLIRKLLRPPILVNGKLQ